MTPLVRVEQCDRRAAASVSDNLADAPAYKDGRRDDSYLVQAFAAHRQEAEAAATERAAKVAETLATRVQDAVNRWGAQCEGSAYDAAVEIAAAIRENRKGIDA